MTAQQQLLRAIIFGRPPASTSNVEARGPDLCFACGQRAIGTRGRDAACWKHADTFNGTKGAT